MGLSKNTQPTKKEKYTRYSLITLAVVSVAYLIYYMSTGWEVVTVEKFSTCRNASSYWLAEYSESSYNVIEEEEWEYDSWSELASRINTLTQYDGNAINNSGVKVDGLVYPQLPPKKRVSKVDLDRIVPIFEDEFLVQGRFGVHEVNRNQYFKILNKKFAHKPIYANIHHGRFFSYSASK